MRRFFRLLFSYLRLHAAVLLAAGLCLLTIAAVFSLYELPPEPVRYAAALCALVVLVVGGLRFAAFWRRHRALTELQARLAASLAPLPAPQSIIEQDYQALIRVLHDSRMRLTLEADLARTEMSDYYTLWAHQIKTPITALRLLAQELPEAEAGPLLAELFKIEQYVEMALGYLRLESPSTDYVFRTYDLDALVRQCLRKYARLFIGKRLSVDYEPVSCRVLTDEKWLCFVIEQILSNAVKYTHAGGVRIYLARERVLAVADTGIGIAAEDLPRVCEKGFTGYNGRMDKRATGLGLYLCKTIMAKLGHTLEIESRPGEGTTVYLGLDTLPSVVE